MHDVLAFQLDGLAWVRALVEQVYLLVQLECAFFVEARPAVRTGLRESIVYLLDFEPAREAVRMEHMVAVCQLNLLIVLDGRQAYDTLMPVFDFRVEFLILDIREVVLNFVHGQPGTPTDISSIGGGGRRHPLHKADHRHEDAPYQHNAEYHEGVLADAVVYVSKVST